MSVVHLWLGSAPSSGGPLGLLLLHECLEGFVNARETMPLGPPLHSLQNSLEDSTARDLGSGKLPQEPACAPEHWRPPPQPAPHSLSSRRAPADPALRNLKSEEEEGLRPFFHLWHAALLVWDSIRTTQYNSTRTKRVRVWASHMQTQTPLV